VAKKRPKGGRPTNLTPAVQAKICEALLAGSTRKAASRYGGIGDRTFSRWMIAGKRAGKYRQFCLAVEAAESECQRGYELVIHKAAHERPVTTTKVTTGKDKDGNLFVKNEKTVKTEIDWGAAAWWLERRRRRDYHPNHKREVEEAVNKAIKALLENGTLQTPGLESGAAGNAATGGPNRGQPHPEPDPQ
jgi:hypothetical protein